jgi:arylsulfatase A-like enzyme
MKIKANRRDFLKLAGTLPVSLAASRTLKKLGVPVNQAGKYNVLVIVFDAWSAYHVSTYGYQRETTPNLARLAERAVVYHNHYASGNFTTPGTASLLTGALPWTHRAFQSNGTVADPFITQNIFGAFPNHYRIAFTHNPWANTLLEQFKNELDEFVPRFSLFLGSFNDEIIHRTFKNDDDIASVSWGRNVNLSDDGYAYSLFFSHLYGILQERSVTAYKKLFPRGIPSIGDAQNSFVLEEAVNWTAKRLTQIPQPFLGYFHYLPPHDPYRPSIEFIGAFKEDGYQPAEKPNDVFSKQVSNAEMLKLRTEYDEFILYADNQLGNLFNQLEESGLLENTWVVVTSDHGELFERGIVGHGTDAMYESVIRVPLMIFEPGRSSRTDIHYLTSAIDLLPTLLHVTGQEIPAWAEGKVLPPYADDSPDLKRSVYAMRSNKNGKYSPLTRASIILAKGRYKLHYYFGYVDHGIADMVKLYDVIADPEELVDLASIQKEIASELLDQLKAKLADANKPYL